MSAYRVKFLLDCWFELFSQAGIRASVPTIKYLLDNGARVAVSSHLGRPKNGPEVSDVKLSPVLCSLPSEKAYNLSGMTQDKFSLAPCAARLSELLGMVPVRVRAQNARKNVSCRILQARRSIARDFTRSLNCFMES